MGQQEGTEHAARGFRTRMREGFEEFLATEAAGAVVLLAAAVVALIVANSPLHSTWEQFWNTELGVAAGQFRFSLTLVRWVNDMLMVLFFFVVGLEIKREILVGELSDRRKALLPVLAAIGGLITPAIIYTAMNAGGVGVRGWGVPIATDIAFAVGAMALLGNRVPPSMKVFLVALAVADDIGAILVIALFYTPGVLLVWLAAAAVLFVVLIGLNRAGVDSPWPYFLVGGALWGAVLMSGIHATIAGVLVAATIPAAAKLDPLSFARVTRSRLGVIEAADVPGEHTCASDIQQIEAFGIRQDARHAAAPLQRLEFALHPWTTFVVLPLFALSNAGVRLIGADVKALLTSNIALGVILGLVIGKPLGIGLATWLAVRIKCAALPEGVGWQQLVGVGMLAGIGFTMSLFVTSIAFPAPPQSAEAKLAIIVASVTAGVLGYAWLRFTTAKTGAE